MNIFTANTIPLPGERAISTAASSLDSIRFSASTVFGDIGVTQPGGPFLLNIFGANNNATVTFATAAVLTA